ncbi:MAG: osmoprotectant transport system ATP-binding protein [Clostridiales bacterium]|nr:osmoprotectant transport system ATP-binding protein [Clostridiales bacterium]MDK2933256.1 osmoprotectant transport system ATP-binding protein [Clostridiales bacterium]
MVRFENVKKAYNDVTVIEDLNLHIKEGQLVVLIGPSGCGKTTTLKMINRIIEPTSGSIYIDGEDITKVNPVMLRRKIGYVIQQIGLFPNMTIAQNVEIIPKLLGWPADKRRKRTEELLHMVDMSPEQYADRYPSELSGGQQQRIGVLRALAAEPPLVLMDEPFGALDPITRESLQDEVKRLQKKLKKTIVFVTHDMDEALKIADVIVLMKDGKIVQAASPEELLSNPANDFVAQFIGKHRLNDGLEIETVEDVMRHDPVTVTKDIGTSESVALMKRKGVNSLLVVDDEGRLEGVVTVDKIRKQGKAGRNISELIDKDIRTIPTNTNAREAFDILIEDKLDYLAVVDDKNKVKGLVTKTSIVKALAEVVWKDNGHE